MESFRKKFQLKFKEFKRVGRELNRAGRELNRAGRGWGKLSLFEPNESFVKFVNREI